MGIIDFFKKIIQVKNNDLSFLNVGDIIWARRYKTDDEKQKYAYGHQESPYVIIKKTKNKVFALQSTSNPHQEIKWKMLYYPLGRLSYNMKKNSYINCLKAYELKEVQYVETIGRLSDYDLNQLKKHLFILINSDFKIKPDIEKKYLDYKISIGDIILKDGNRYYVNSIEDKYYITYRLRNKTKKDYNILINNTYYSFIFNMPEKINKHSKFILVDTFNTGEIEIINKHHEEILNRDNEKRIQTEVKSLRIGAVIDYNENMYYLYDIVSDDLYFYHIYPNNKANDKKIANIKIKNGFYKTYFATVIIPKETLEQKEYKIRRCANNDEIEYNKMVAQLPTNKRREENKKNNKINTIKKKTTMTRGTDDFRPMMILKNDNNQKYYLVISRENNIIEVININNMSDSFYFELQENNCPFKYYRILSKEEYNIYLNKLKEVKETIATFNQ